MKKNFSLKILDECNLLVLFCIIFTIGMMFEAIMSSIRGAPVYFNIEFIFWSSAFYSAPILTSAIFKQLWKSNYIAEKDFLYWLDIPLHYLATCGLIMFYTFIQGFFHSLPQRIYLIRFIYSTVFYVTITIGAIVIDLIQTGIANDNLRKIQEKEKQIKR